MVDHAPDGPPEHLGGRLEVVRSLSGVGVHLLLPELGPLHAVADKGSRDAKLLAPDDDDLLSGKEFLSDNGGEAAHKVVARVNDDGTLKHIGVDLEGGWEGRGEGGGGVRY